MYNNSLCIITPTIGRPTLAQTLSSAALSIFDEWLVIGDGPQPQARKLVEMWGAPYHYIEHPLSGDYGNRLRDFAMRVSTKDWFIFLDDDDEFAPGAIETIRRTIEDTHCPHLFKVRHPDGRILWQTAALHTGNISGSMFVVPNVPEKLGRWANGAEYGSDAKFIVDTCEKWGNDVRWIDEVIIICKPGGIS